MISRDEKKKRGGEEGLSIPGVVFTSSVYHHGVVERSDIDRQIDSPLFSAIFHGEKSTSSWLEEKPSGLIRTKAHSVSGIDRPLSFVRPSFSSWRNGQSWLEPSRGFFLRFGASLQFISAILSSLIRGGGGSFIWGMEEEEGGAAFDESRVMYFL